MKDLKIDKEFFVHLPRHTDEEHANLEAMILEDGECRDPLVVWKGKDIIVGGHERYAICKEHKLPFKVHEREFESRADVLEWISADAVSQRQLTPVQLKYHLGIMYNSRKGKHGGARDGGRGGSVAEKMADEQGISAGTVAAAGAFAEALDEATEKGGPSLKGAILDGKAKATTEELKEIAKAPKKKAKKKAHEKLEGEDEPEPEPKAEAGNKIVDGNGKVVKDPRYQAVFADMEEFHAKERECKALIAGLKRLAESDGGVNLHIDEMVVRIKGVIDELKARRPRVVCTVCGGEKIVEMDGKRHECSACMSLGFLDEHLFSVLAKSKRK